jgi:hypothetical protein
MLCPTLNGRFGPLADIAPTGVECAERGYLCKMHHFIAVATCEA